MLEWLEESTPDVVLLQELKCRTGDFPLLEINASGYEATVLGQKAYNGVAILVRRGQAGINDVRYGLPGDDGPDGITDDDGHGTDQARYVEADVAGLRVASLYLPNGNPAPGPKFDYKLRWMARLHRHVAENLLPLEVPLVLGGDYNVCPTDDDVFDPAAFADDALCRSESRGAFRALVNLGLTEAWKVQNPGLAHRYSYWDYGAGAWQKDNGLRIDHFLLNARAADRLVACDIDRRPRGREKPSDHTPVCCIIDHPA